MTDQALTEADPLIARVFATWCARRASAGRVVSLIDLYVLVAAERGVEPHQLDTGERALLARLAFGVIWPGFETIPGSERGFEPVVIVAYDPGWPERFERWRARIAGVLGRSALAIEHVGSTSVPGLAAKPIVDIQVSVAALENESAYVPALAEVGLQLRSRDELHRHLRPFAGFPRDVHVHVCAQGETWEREHLLLRDYLRTHPHAVLAYGAAKQELAVRWREDSVAYSEAKSDVILDTLRAAEDWAASTGWAVGGEARRLT
ncbi:MAG TPA: GrpB family protein [Solirubrobacteraceae bacterium]|nr:GrpB family protein [Solirubrobacteraceae bacterium]